MIRLSVPEHTRIVRRDDRTARTVAGEASLPARLYDRLRRFERLSRADSERVLDWGDGFARTTQWVGVIQIPGLQLEVFPKIDWWEGEARGDGGEIRHEARRNLLYMLALGGEVPVRSRDVAKLALRRAPLTETLAAIFADRLREELLRGADRGYVPQLENLRRFKGRLVVTQQVLHNAAHRERFYCGYDEFLDDTLMNRVFKASCRLLLSLTRSPSTQDVLRRCLLLLESVSDIQLQNSDFSQIRITRQNERFGDVLRFCQLLASGQSPTVQGGTTRTFSLLFDMNRVFERFVAAFVRRHVLPRFPGVQLFPQAVGQARHLMTSDGVGTLRLEPDLLLEREGRRVVVDTKWKLLATNRRGRGAVAESDLYQLFAYTRRYGCARSVLLYPHTPGLEPREFEVLDQHGATSGERVMVRQVKLHRNLWDAGERTALADELGALVREALQLEVGLSPTLKGLRGVA